jgi:hypothetical protein
MVGRRAEEECTYCLRNKAVLPRCVVIDKGENFGMCELPLGCITDGCLDIDNGHPRPYTPPLRDQAPNLDANPTQNITQ